MRIPANQSNTMTKHISTGQGGSASVRFDISRYSQGDFLDLDVYRERSNLRVFTPSIDPDTGELYLRWAVTTQHPFTPEAYVSVNLWGNGSETGYEQSLGRWWLNACANRGNCSSTIRVPLEERVPIDLGKKWLTARIDHDSQHPETDEWDNFRSFYIDDFFSEAIPSIMTAHSTSWMCRGFS